MKNDDLSETPNTKHQTRSIIIALTSSAFEEDKAAILALGCDDFLRKPVTETDIFEALRQHLEVTYLYAEQPQQAADDNRQTIGQHVLTPAAIAALPLELVGQIEQAILQGDVDGIDQSIERLRPFDEQIADALARLARRFEHDALLTLIQNAKGKE